MAINGSEQPRRRRWWTRRSITTKYLVYILTLAAVILALTSFAAVALVEQVSRSAEDSIVELGETMAVQGSAALEEVAKGALYQKALDVAGQIRIFADAHPELSQRELCEDPAFINVAVQPIGKRGYTSIIEQLSGVVLCHSNPELIGVELETLAGRLPAFWQIVEGGLDGSVVGGFYSWLEPDGGQSQKFMYLVPVPGTELIVAATAYYDELMEPSQQIVSTNQMAAVNYGQIVRQQKDEMRFVLVGFAAGLLMITIAVAWWLAFLVTRPIRLLTHGARTIGEGDFDHRVSITTGDEIEELADQFNTMTRALKESYTILEDKVAERTLAEHRRSEQLRAINAVGRSISSIMSLDELLPHIVRSMQESFSYSSINIFLSEPDLDDLVLRAGAGNSQVEFPIGYVIRLEQGLVGRAARDGEAVVANDVSREPDYLFIPEFADTRAEMAIPIRFGERRIGVLDIQSTGVDAFDEIDLGTAETLADSIAIAVENARLYQETSQGAVIEERNRMAREIHDTLAQGFTGIVLQLEAAEAELKDTNPKVHDYLDQARKLARESLKEARRSVMALRPKSADQAPLVQILQREVENFGKETDIRAVFDFHGQPVSVSGDARHALLRITQEALTNVKNHARANLVKVNLAAQANVLRLTVEDNGRGFEMERVDEGHFGLTGMRERARLLGGVMVVRSEKDIGTVVEVTVPLEGEPQDDAD